MMTIEMLERLAAMGKRIVLTLHDEWMFTGGCHYSFGCEGFVSSCEQCPQLISDPVGIPSRVLDRRVSACSQIAGTVITPSKWLGESSARSRVLGSWKHEVIPYALDTKLFAPSPRDKALKKLGLDQARTWALMITSDHDERKGGHILVRALEHALGSDPIIRNSLGIILVGQCASHQHELESLGLSVHICTPKDDTELAGLYAASTCMVLPTLADNLPNTMLESLACGRPVIGSDVGGVPDFVIQNTTGSLFQVADIESLSGLLSQLALNPRSFEQMNDACRALIEERCDPAIHARSWARAAAATDPSSQITVGDDTPIQNGVLRMLTQCVQSELQTTSCEQHAIDSAKHSVQLRKALAQRDELARRLQTAQNTISRQHSSNLEAIDELSAGVEQSRSLAHLQHESIGQRVEQSRIHVEAHFAEHFGNLTESINAQRTALQKARLSQIEIDKLKDKLAEVTGEIHKTRVFNASLTESRDDALGQLVDARNSHAAVRDKYEAECVRSTTFESQIAEVKDQNDNQLQATHTQIQQLEDELLTSNANLLTSNTNLQVLKEQHAALLPQFSQSLSKRARISLGWIMNGKWPDPQIEQPAATSNDDALDRSQDDSNG